MNDLLLLLSALFSAIADEGRRLMPLPSWGMALIYTLLTAMSCLAAYRSKCHPSAFRRSVLNAYALVAVIMLPARATDEPGVARVAFAVLSTFLMFSLASSPLNATPCPEEEHHD